MWMWLQSDYIQRCSRKQGPQFWQKYITQCFIIFAAQEMTGKMADNYLEKQYADYERRKAEWLKAKKCGKFKKKFSANNKLK